MKSVLVVKSATYTHSVEVKTSDFIVETLPKFSITISLERSSFKKSFGVFEVYIIFLNRSYISCNFHDKLFRYCSSKMANP